MDPLENMKREQLARIERAAELIAQPAEAAGFRCVAQMFLAAPYTDDEGVERLAAGPLRYSARAVALDYAAMPEGTPCTASFVVRFEDPETPEGAAALAFHEQARKLEREALGGE